MREGKKKEEVGRREEKGEEVRETGRQKNA